MPSPGCWPIDGSVFVTSAYVIGDESRKNLAGQHLFDSQSHRARMPCAECGQNSTGKMKHDQSEHDDHNQRRGFRSGIDPELRSLRSTGITRRQHYYGPLPRRPSLLITEFPFEAEQVTTDTGRDRFGHVRFIPSAVSPFWIHDPLRFPWRKNCQ